MYKYLEAWRSTMPAIQGAQVVQILTEMRDQGIIKTEEEYRSVLNRLTGVIKGSDPIPTVKLFSAILNDYADSESFNWMINRLTDDLTSGFNEAQAIEDLLVAHQKVYEEFTLAKLKQLIEQVRADVNFHSLLRRNQEGFSNLQYNTFTQNSKSTPPTYKDASKLYFDKSAGEQVTTLAVIDVVNEALELPSSLNTERFVNIWEEDADTHDSDAFYFVEGNDKSNTIDNQSNTFFIRPFFFLPENKPTSGAQLKLKLDCGGLRPINYIEVQPVADYPFQVIAIEYLDNAGNTYSVELQESGLLGQDIFRPVRYHFTEVSARTVWVTCLQEHYTLINFFDSSVKEDPEEDFAGTYLNSQIVQDAVSSLTSTNPFLQDIQDLFEPSETEQLLYQYVMGFDNILTGKLDYDEIGIFVGEVFKVSRCRRIGLETEEVATNEILSNRRASFEYWIYKEDYNDQGSWIGTTHLPIMPLVDIRAYERFELTERDGLHEPQIGTLRFQGHFGTVPTGDEEVFVYLNGVELTYGELEDWYFKDEVLLGTRTDTRIKINAPQDGEIYTVSYVPVQFHPAAAGESFFQNQQPHAFYKDASNILFTNGSIGSEEVDSSDIFLITIMKRNNNEDISQTSVLNEYSLLVASQDPTRLYPEN